MSSLASLAAYVTKKPMEARVSEVKQGEGPREILRLTHDGVLTVDLRSAIEVLCEAAVNAERERMANKIKKRLTIYRTKAEQSGLSALSLLTPYENYKNMEEAIEVMALELGLADAIASGEHEVKGQE